MMNDDTKFVLIGSRRKLVTINTKYILLLLVIMILIQACGLEISTCGLHNITEEHLSPDSFLTLKTHSLVTSR